VVSTPVSYFRALTDFTPFSDDVSTADFINYRHEKVGTTSPTSGGRSVGIVRSRTKATEFSFSFSLELDDMIIMPLPSSRSKNEASKKVT
jgi:hypothetical protein